MIRISKNIFAWLLILAVLLCSFGCDNVSAETDAETESIFESEIIESDMTDGESNEESREESDSVASTESGTTIESDSSESESDEALTESETETTSNETDAIETGSEASTDIIIYEKLNSPSNHTVASSYEDAISRSEEGKLSGYDYVPDQAPILSPYRPQKDGVYIKNSDSYYIDSNTYVVIDAYGREVFRIYRGGAYITLEEVAAYIYAFGEPPANHSSSKRTKPTQSIWGIYLRVNNTKFSGDTTRYPYEPVLPRISGCGGLFRLYGASRKGSCDGNDHPRNRSSGAGRQTLLHDAWRGKRKYGSVFGKRHRRSQYCGRTCYGNHRGNRYLETP